MRLPRPTPPQRWRQSAAPVENIAFTGEAERGTRQGDEARETYVHKAYRARGSASKRAAILAAQAEQLAALQAMNPAKAPWQQEMRGVESLRG